VPCWRRGIADAFTDLPIGRSGPEFPAQEALEFRRRTAENALNQCCIGWGRRHVRYRFDDCELDTDRHELRRGGAAQPLEPLAFDLLRHLIENRERVVSKDDLRATVWSGRVVSESTLSSWMTTVRAAIGDDGEAQRLIRTVPRRGFRFVGTISEGAAPESDTPVSPGPAVQPAAADPAAPSLRCW
jgi:DNA-binding winged helix-turn-helix (wHTH) protein